MSDINIRRRAKRALTPWKGANFEPLANSRSSTFEETYPKLPFAELVRLSLHLARGLKRIAGGRGSKESLGFGARKLVPKSPGGGGTRGAVAPGDIRCAQRSHGNAAGKRPAKTLERRSA